MMPYDRLPKWVLRSGLAGSLSKSALLALWAMSDCMDGHRWDGSVGVPTIAKITGLSERAVRNGIAELVEAGIIDRGIRSAEFKINKPQRNDGAAERHNGSVHAGLNGTTVPDERNDGSGRTAQPFRSRSRNKEVPKPSSKTFLQEEEPTASAADGIRFNQIATDMIVRTGFPTPDPRDLRELLGAVDRIKSGMYPEALSVDDQLDYLEPRLKYYWDEQAIRRINAEKKLDKPALWRTLKEDRWRVDLDRPLPEIDESKKPKAIHPARQRMLDRWEQRIQEAKRG